jgi:hypothetical protein
MLECQISHTFKNWTTTVWSSRAKTSHCTVCNIQEESTSKQLKYKVHFIKILYKWQILILYSIQSKKNDYQSFFSPTDAQLDSLKTILNLQ